MSKRLRIDLKKLANFKGENHCMAYLTFYRFRNILKTKTKVEKLKLLQCYFFNLGYSKPLFLYFCLFNTVDSKYK